MIRVLFTFLFVTLSLGGQCSITAPSATATTWVVQNSLSPNNGITRVIPRTTEVGDYCLGDNPTTFCDQGNFGQCTANDIKLAQATYVAGPKTCTIGTRIVLTMAVEWVSTANQRYDVSAYIAMDGGNAMYGSCYGTILYGNIGTWPSDSTCSNCGSGTIGGPSSLTNGPYLEASSPLDKCRDLAQDQNTWQTLTDVPFICRDANGDGTADISACLGWQQNANEASCNGIDRAIVTAGSKCNCEKSINIQGLTVCSSQQTLCYSNTGVLNSGVCEPSFSARFKVQTSATATNFPTSSVLYGRVYLDFADSDQRMAIQYFNPSGTINSDAALQNTSLTTAQSAVQVVRTDILWPCKAIQKVSCTSGCTTLFSNNWIPRIFREGTYTVDTANSKLTPDTTGVTCPTVPWSGFGTPSASCALKTNVPNSPATAIDYVWFATDTQETAGRTVLHGARQRDGTFWEFLKEANDLGSLNCQQLGTPFARGMTLAHPITTASGASRDNPFNLPCNNTLFDYTQFDSQTGCGTTQPVCTADAQVVFAIDQSSSITLSDWTNYWIPYVWSTVSGFDPNNAQDVFGFCFSAGLNGGQSPYCNPLGLVSSRSSICNTFLKVGTFPSCGGASTLPKVQTSSSTDFRGLISLALTNYFPSAGGTPRRLVVLVGGPDAGSTIAWSTLWANATAVGVQISAVGIGAGSANTGLLQNIVGTTGGTWSQWASASFLPGDSYLYRRLCPAATPICSCSGFCACAGSTGVCPPSCSSSTTSPCNPASCDPANPCAGCVSSPKVCSNPCFLCDDANNGDCTKPYACPDAGQDTYCFDWNCQVVNGKATCVSTPKPPCNDNNGCTTDSCVIGRGCVFNDASSTLCKDGNACTVDACTSVSGLPVCSYTPINVQQVCGDGNVCTTDSCDSVTGQCVHSSPLTCNDNNACTTDFCDSISGCQHATVNCNDGNPCTTDTCNSATGCSNIAINCDDGNACTTDSCSNGICTHVAKVCNDGKACTVDTCDTFTGACVYSCTAPSCDSTCANSDCCPASCSAGNGVNCPLSAPSNKCKQSVCVTDSTLCGSQGTWDTTSGYSTASCQAAGSAGKAYCGVIDNSGKCTSSNKCIISTCDTSTGSCATSSVNCNDGNICTADFCETATGLCNYASASTFKTTCESQGTTDKCNTYACNPATGTCQVTPISCNDGNPCTIDTCSPSGGCSYQAITCNDGNSCTDDTCDTTTGNCKFTAISSGRCQGCAWSGAASACGIPAANKCAPITCIDVCSNCDTSLYTNCANCAAAVADTTKGFFCAVGDLSTPCAAKGSDCTTYTCDTLSGSCVSSRSNFAKTCDTATAANPCTPQLCVEGARDSTNNKVCVAQQSACIGVEVANKCAGVKCQVDTTILAGYQCVADTTAQRSCTDFTCTAGATSTNPAFSEYVVGVDAQQQFLANYASRSPSCTQVLCTIDTCDTATGCVNALQQCAAPPNTCNASIGCFEAGNTYGFTPGVCQLQVDQSLIDFCGVCFGDYASCFFQTVIPVTTVAAIAGGAIAGITIAAIIAALLIFWLTKKGYDYWQAQSHLASTGLSDNPAYVSPSTQGTIPD